MNLPNPLVPGWYKTRDGQLAEVLTIVDAKYAKMKGLKDTVFGVVDDDVVTEWCLDGVFDCYPSGLDLVKFLGTEKPKTKVTKTVERWVNIYPGETFGADHHGSCSAAHSASTNRLAVTVKLTGSYEVEE